jgi:hypothetical protein
VWVILWAGERAKPGGGGAGGGARPRPGAGARGGAPPRRPAHPPPPARRARPEAGSWSPGPPSERIPHAHADGARALPGVTAVQEGFRVDVGDRAVVEQVLDIDACGQLVERARQRGVHHGVGVGVAEGRADHVRLAGRVGEGPRERAHVIDRHGGVALPGVHQAEIVIDQQRALEARAGQPDAGFRAGDRRLLRGQGRDLGLVERAVQADAPPVGGQRGEFEFDAAAAGAADIGGELDGVRNPVGLDLDVVPVNLIQRDIGDQAVVEPGALEAGLVVDQIIRIRTERDDQVVRIEQAGLARICVDHRCPEAGRHRGVGGERGLDPPRGAQPVGGSGLGGLLTGRLFDGRQCQRSGNAGQGVGKVVGVVPARLGEGLRVDAAVAQAAGDPHVLIEPVGQLAERGRLVLDAVRVQALIVLVGQAGDAARVQEGLVGAVAEIHVPLALEVEPADDPVEPLARIGDQPGFLHEVLIVGVRVQREGDGLAERARQICVEALVEARIGGRAGQGRAVELIVQRHVVVGHLAGEPVGAVRAPHILAQIGVGQRGIARIALLARDQEAQGHPVGGLPQQGRPSAPGFQRVRVLHPGPDIGHMTLFMAGEAHHAQAERVLDQRHVDHGVVALAHGVRSRHADIAQHRGFKGVQVRTAGQDAQRPRQRARAEQRALRTAKEFDALHVVQAGIENGGVAVRRDRQLVDIDRHRALQIGVVAVRRDAARGEIVEVRRGPVDHHARRLEGQPLIADDAFRIELVLGQSRDAQRHVLEPLGPARGRDHDDFHAGLDAGLLALAVALGLRLGLGQRGQQRARADRREKCRFHQISSRHADHECRRLAKLNHANAHPSTFTLTCVNVKLRTRPASPAGQGENAHDRSARRSGFGDRDGRNPARSGHGQGFVRPRHRPSQARRRRGRASVRLAADRLAESALEKQVRNSEWQTSKVRVANPDN